MISATCFRSKDNFLLHAMEYNGPPRICLYVVAFVVVAIAVLLFTTDWFIYFEAFANWMQTQGSLGMLLVGGCCILCSFPPVPGFSLVVILGGFTFGWLGFIPVALGTFVGGMLCFVVARAMCAGCMASIVQSHQSLVLVNKILHKAVVEGNFGTLVLLRLAPYPYNIMNTVLGLSDLSATRCFPCLPCLFSCALWVLSQPLVS